MMIDVITNPNDPGGQVETITETRKESHTPDFLELKRQEFKDRLDQIRPQAEELQAEVETLEAALATLEDLDQAPARGRVTKRRNGKTRLTQGGRKAEQVVEVLREAHGTPMSIRDIAARIDTHPNYLYRVMPSLEDQGKVVKEGRAFRIA